VMALLASFAPAAGLDVGLFRGFMVAGGVGTVLTAGYFLWMLQRVNLGALPDRWRVADFGDIETVEWLAWVPMLVLIVVLGVYPRLVFGVTTDAVDRLVAVISAAAG
jgi:NADH-quinone oxidoreductase subunit M